MEKIIIKNIQVSKENQEKKFQEDLLQHDKMSIPVYGTRVILEDIVIEWNPDDQWVEFITKKQVKK